MNELPCELKVGQETPFPKDLFSRRPGMRLMAVEVLNWGTFHAQVWPFDLQGENALLTGANGSGKSTLIDAITTLLVPAPKISYNKAAGAQARERDLRSYVLGHYKSERGDVGLSAKPVALRTSDKAFSVILGRFCNEDFDEQVTIAQVFWFKEPTGQPTRFYLVADKTLSIADDFSGFGRDIKALKKRLRKTRHIDVFDTFPPYGAAFRRRFGIASEQALDLFAQTVSMKSIGNLTHFVRKHMLEPFPVDERIDQMICHFDDLSRAHEAVLKARDQIERLTPIVSNCDRHSKLAAEIDQKKACREALGAYFATLKQELLGKRIKVLESKIGRLSESIVNCEAAKNDREGERDAIRQAIMENGGDRIASLDHEIRAKKSARDERQRRAEDFNNLVKEAGLAIPTDARQFLETETRILKDLASVQTQETDLQNSHVEQEIAFRELRDEHDGLYREITSLKSRRSNLPSRMLDIRDHLCTALKLDTEKLPFAGELIEVRKGGAAWEGVAERLLHNFALSLLVPDEHYAAVSQWVNATHLAGRLVYFRVREQTGSQRQHLRKDSLSEKLRLKDESPLYQWLQREVDQRFNHICCDSLDVFRRETKAITRSGQIKTGGVRHEKDDRTRIGDKTRYVLGWSNETKNAALEEKAANLKARIQTAASDLAALGRQQGSLRQRLGVLQQLSTFKNFRDLDWRCVAIDIERLSDERRQLEEGSDKLKTLAKQLDAVEAALQQAQAKLQSAESKKAVFDDRLRDATRQTMDTEKVISEVPEETRASLFLKLDDMRAQALGEHRLTIENCDKRASDMRTWLQQRIDIDTQRLTRLRDQIISAMTKYANVYVQETREVDAAIDSASEYQAMLTSLEDDDLPRFEARFKTLLNENTINEVAGFQSQLAREAHEIKERVDIINRSLRDIEYNDGRYILLSCDPTIDAQIREFQTDLRSCTENTLSGDRDSSYTETKFLQVREIIERFRGRDGLDQSDKDWTRKVTDVRNWFEFSASERWKEDDSEHEHYSDSGGKSGGQKEKLAYTVLAASLAYQFNLNWLKERSRSFHFVVIDEAFGRGSDEAAEYGLKLFKKMGMQLLIATPLQKIHVIEPFVASVGFVHNEDGKNSLLRNMTIEEYRSKQLRRAG